MANSRNGQKGSKAPTRVTARKRSEINCFRLSILDILMHGFRGSDEFAPILSTNRLPRLKSS